MPVYNAASSLLKALDSLLKQTIENWELVVVDDGSTDNSAEIVKSVNDDRIKLISSPHRGIIEALNLGLEHCQGDWVVRMDADDIAHPGRLEMLLSYAEACPDVDIWGSLVSLFPRKMLKNGMIEYEKWLNSLRTHQDIRNNLFVECPVAHPSLMVRHKALLDISGYQDKGWPEDYDLILRLFLAGYVFKKIPRRLHFWRYHPEKTSLTDQRYSTRNFFRLKYEYFKKIFPANKRDVIIIGFADNGKAWLKALLKDNYSVKYILDLHPGRIGHKMVGVPVIHPDEFAGDGFFVSTASSEGTRDQVRSWLTGQNFKEWDDFVCVA